MNHKQLLEGQRQFKQFEKEQKRFISALIREFSERARKMSKQLNQNDLIKALEKLADELDNKWKDYAKLRTKQTGIPVFEDAFQKNLMAEVTRNSNENQRNIHQHELRITTNNANDERITEQNSEGGKTIDFSERRKTESD